jgi:hypothetical protein
MTQLFPIITVLLTLQAQHSPAHDRADQAMGFDQQRTTHHFRIEPTGGVIEVTAKDAADQASIDEIRMHLQHIAVAFGNGDFALPMLVHDTTPPGINTMKARRAMMTFTFEQLATGGRVVIRTSVEQARQALHEFLRFQIREHHTGDPIKNE